ncbi:MAG TPA: hypothetical protein VJS66_02285 [Burkholderiales bacterium]|nr:hypothetical protein [Burkholderiales bacterium]
MTDPDDPEHRTIERLLREFRILLPPVVDAADSDFPDADDTIDDAAPLPRLDTERTQDEA